MTEPAGAAAPDLAWPVIGYRAWRLGRLGPAWTRATSIAEQANASLALFPRVSAISREPWAPGVHVATCSRPVCDISPGPSCSCGLYAYHDVDRPARDPHPGRTVTGAIAGWGRLEVHADGFRAQRACVLALAAPPAALQTLRRDTEEVAARYGVPLVDRAQLEAEALRHGRPVPRELRPASTTSAAPHGVRLDWTSITCSMAQSMEELGRLAKEAGGAMEPLLRQEGRLTVEPPPRRPRRSDR